MCARSRHSTASSRWGRCHSGDTEGATHPAFEQAQLAHERVKILSALADTIHNDPNMMPGTDATRFIVEEIETQIRIAENEERAMSHRHFLYLLGECDD